jgi:hypothetical protein
MHWYLMGKGGIEGLYNCYSPAGTPLNLVQLRTTNINTVLINNVLSESNDDSGVCFRATQDHNLKVLTDKAYQS